jgi:hypothetical protein
VRESRGPAVSSKAASAGISSSGGVASDISSVPQADKNRLSTLKRMMQRFIVISLKGIRIIN